MQSSLSTAFMGLEKMLCRMYCMCTANKFLKSIALSNSKETSLEQLKAIIARESLLHAKSVFYLELFQKEMQEFFINRKIILIHSPQTQANKNHRHAHNKTKI